jgi:hypothetical protein
MKYSWVFRIVGAVLLVIGIAAVAYFAYTAGVTQGQAAAPAAVTVNEAAVRSGFWGWHPFAGLAFLPLLLCLGPFFLCLFILMPLRMIFGPHRMHMHGRWRDGEHFVPPPFEEWHRRMHETKKEDD